MKYFLQQFVKTPMLIVFALMIVFFGLGALGKIAEVEEYAVVTAIGIDKVEEEDENRYEVSFMTLIPVAEQNFTERYKIISAKGRNVSEAIDFAGLDIGRQVGLSHLKIIVLSQQLLHEDLYEFLDYLARTIQLSLSTKVVATHDDSAKDFLKTAQKLDSESSIKVSELIAFNSDYIYSTDSSLETFFKGSFGPTKVGLMACLTSQNGGDQVLESMSSNSSMGGESSSTSQEDNITQCHVDIFKDGKLALAVDGKQMKKINLVKGDYSTGSIQITNFTDKFFEDADVTFEVFGKRQKFYVSYQNGIPVVQIDIKLTLRLSEVNDKNGILKENVEFFAISDEALKAIEQKVRHSIGEGLTIMRENQIDIADFYTILFNNNKKAFKNFLNSLEDQEDYLNHIIFKTNVKVYAK